MLLGEIVDLPSPILDHCGRKAKEDRRRGSWKRRKGQVKKVLGKMETGRQRWRKPEGKRDVSAEPNHLAAGCSHYDTLLTSL